MTLARHDHRPELATRHRIRRRDPDLERAAGALALWYAEHRAGRRSLTQVHRALTPTLRRRLAQRVAVARATSVHRVRAVVLQGPAPDVREATVLVSRDDARVTAVCVRFERTAGRWLVAELTAPEDGEAAVVTERDPYAGLDAFDLVGA